MRGFHRLSGGSTGEEARERCIDAGAATAD
jgi:hypothetical protein